MYVPPKDKSLTPTNVLNKVTITSPTRCTKCVDSEEMEYVNTLKRIVISSTNGLISCLLFSGNTSSVINEHRESDLNVVIEAMDSIKFHFGSNKFHDQHCRFNETNLFMLSTD